MNYKDAKSFFENFIKILEKNGEKEILNNQYCAAAKLAIEALEKQIPKKPYLEEDKIWRCSVCDNGLRFKRDVYVPDGQNFCMCCGRAIDWGDE